jgi:hypothetical protein
MRTVEINGIKLEIDERTARTVEQYRVGDRVKVLVKRYEQYTIYVGVIVGFADFAKLPSIEVMYLSTDSWDSDPLKFATLNEKNEDVELAPMNEAEIVLDRGDVVRRFDQEIRKRELALEDMQTKREYFISKFAAAFADEAEAVT